MIRSKKGLRWQSGVCVHATGPNLPLWPKAVEVELVERQSGNLRLHRNFVLRKSPESTELTSSLYERLFKEAEKKKIGEWNDLEFTCWGNTIQVVINNNRANEATEAWISKGRILLQSEGDEVYFRDIELELLDLPG